jgi:hypothetical protein
MATAAERYALLERGRNTILRQAREATRLTIPGLIPDEGASDPHDVSEQPYSSLGARGVNNVAAKTLLSLFPPQRPFFRLDISPETAAGMGAKLGEAQASLAGISHLAMALVDASGSRPLWMEVFRHLIVAGNVLVYHPDDGTVMRVWRLDQYVVRRDAQGRLLEVVIKEEVYPSELTPEVRSAVGIDEDDGKEEGKPSDNSEDKVSVYTVVLAEGDDVIHYQEINDIEVPDSRGQAKKDVAGWQPLRWQAVPGSDYGRSMVSEYAGDFLSLEEGWAAVIKFAAEAARIVRIIDPNSGIDVEELSAADTGDSITGFADKVQTLQLDKSADFNTLWNVLNSIERRLSQAFLLTANTVRDAERVTAEEIRAVAQELEDAFGGTYTVLSAEAQAPYARRVLHILSKQKKAPKLPKTVQPVVVTGFAALGQNHEVAAIVEWVAMLKNTLGEAWVQSRLNGEEIAYRTGVGRGITDVQGLIRDPAEVADEQNQAMTSQMGMAVAPEIAKGAMSAMQNPDLQQGAIDGEE